MSDIYVTLFTGLAAAARRADRDAQVIATAGVTPEPATAAAPTLNPPRQVPVTPDGGIGNGLIGAAVDLLGASLAYRANAAVLKADDDLQRQLLHDLRV